MMATKRGGNDGGDLTDDQIRILIARENLKRYGSVLPPEPTTRVLEPVARKVDWNKVEKRCPHCGITKNVGKEFGIVIRRGLESAAGWCRECRSTTNYYAAKRKNKTQNVEVVDPTKPRRK